MSKPCTFVILSIVFSMIFAFLDKVLPELDGEIVMGVMIGIFLYEGIKGFLTGVKRRLEYRGGFVQECGAERILKEENQCL